MALTVHEQAKLDAEQALCIQVEKVLGRPSVGLRDILKLLAHPDVEPQFDEWVVQVVLVRISK